MACSSSFADSNRVRLSYVDEGANCGVTPPDPNMQIIRLTSSDFAANKQTVVSDEIRADRQTSDLVEVGFDAGGTLNVEMSLGGTYDDFIEGAMASTFSAELPGVATTLTVVAATRTISCTASDAVFAGAVVGQRVRIAGFVGAALPNNGWWEVESVTDSDTIVVLDPLTELVDATGTGVETVMGKSISNGVESRAFSIEQGFTDIEAYQVFRGQRVGSWSMNWESGSILTGSFGFMGESVGTDEPTPTGQDPLTPPMWIGSGGYVAPTTTPVLNATSNVGRIIKDGQVLTTAIQSVTLELDNALRVQTAVSNKFPVGIGYGRVTISGTMSAYFEDLTLYNAMLNHEDVSLELEVSDDLGNSMYVTLPRLKFATDNPAAPGIDQDVIEDIEFQAIVDTTGTYMMQVDIAGN